MVSTRTSSRSYVACTADGEFYFCRLSLIGSAIRKYERAISDLSAIESGASARQVLDYYKRTIGSALSGSTFTVYVVYCYGSHSWFTVGFFEGV